MRLLAYTLTLAVLTLSAAALDDPLVLTASESTTINPANIGAPDSWVSDAPDIMIYGPKAGDIKNFRALLNFDLTHVPKQPVQMAVLKLSFYKLYGIRKTNKDI